MVEEVRPVDQADFRGTYDEQLVARKVGDSIWILQNDLGACRRGVTREGGNLILQRREESFLLLVNNNDGRLLLDLCGWLIDSDYRRWLLLDDHWSRWHGWLLLDNDSRRRCSKRCGRRGSRNDNDGRCRWLGCCRLSLIDDDVFASGTGEDLRRCCWRRCGRCRGR